MAAPEEFETVDAEIVVTEVPSTTVEASRRTLAPAALAAGVAVTGMAAGMATVAVVQRRTARKAAKRRRKVLSNVVASRSFLVDVHVLGDR
jgi:hypothetical protein